MRCKNVLEIIRVGARTDRQRNLATPKSSFCFDYEIWEQAVRNNSNRLTITIGLVFQRLLIFGSVSLALLRKLAQRFR